MDLDKTPSEMSLYEWLCAHDVYEWLKPLWQGGNYYLTDEGKLAPKRVQVAIETPWIHHGHAGFDCMTWSHILFSTVSLRMGKLFDDGAPFVPSGCQGCYKVVVRPQSLIQLFALKDLQEALGRPSKCGTEQRASVHGLYGGYFYNQGLEAGRECYEAVRRAVDQDEYLGPDVPVILKRGCTEMEYACGPSDKWEVRPDQEAIEDLVNQYVVTETTRGEQPDPLKWRIQRQWIQFAYEHGDPTYKKFTGGKPLSPAYVTYHGG